MDTNYADAMNLLKPGTFVPDIGSDSAPKVTPIPETGAVTGDIPSFKDTVKHFLGDVSDKMTTSDTNMKDLAAGRTNDLTKVVTSVEEANLAMQFTLAMRSKLIEAYQEISRISV